MRTRDPHLDQVDPRPDRATPGMVPTAGADGQGQARAALGGPDPRTAGADAPDGSGDEAGDGSPVIWADYAPLGRPNLRELVVLVCQALALVWRAAPRQLVIGGGFQFLAGLGLAAQLVVARRLLQEVAGAAPPPMGALAGDLIAFAALLFLVAAAALAQAEQQRHLGELVTKHATQLILDVSTGVDLIDFDRPAFHDRLERARLNASIRPPQMVGGIVGLLSNGAAVVAVGAVLVWLAPFVAVVMVASSVPLVYFGRQSSRALYAHTVRQTAGDRRRFYLYQAMSRKDEAQEVRAFGNSGYLRAEFDQVYEERIADLRRTIRQRLRYGVASAVSATLATVGALVLILGAVRLGHLPLSDAAVAVGAVILAATRVKALVASTTALYEGAMFLRDFTDFIETGVRQTKQRGRLLPAPPPFERIEFDRVDFTYPSRCEPSLRDISLSVRRGEVIALVGENGSGKTTLTKLLADLYQPTSGAIYWDGVDVTHYSPAHVRAHVAVIFQDFVRYFMTAQENVGISRTDAIGDRAAVRRAAALAGADRFLTALPDGYDGLLGPSFTGGSDLSTGQWQRVALARAYFRDAPMLILDEPTAALDPRGEYEIFQQVRRLAEGRTVVLVSHRFSSVRAADRILVLQEGRIVEEGSHDALMAHGGLYRELFELQAKGYGSTADLQGEVSRE